jgi:hypothetical protein
MSRTGRLFVRLFYPLTCHRTWCGGSVIGLVSYFLRFALRLLVLRPATLAGLVLVVTFLYLKTSGTAEPVWLNVLQSQATAYHDAPAGRVMQPGGCLSDNTQSQANAVSPRPAAPDDSFPSRTCTPRMVAVSIERVAQSDIAVFTTLYTTLVIFSFMWMALRGEVLPVATERKAKCGRAGRVGDDVLIITQEGEYHAMRVNKDGYRATEVRDSTGGRDE